MISKIPKIVARILSFPKVTTAKTTDKTQPMAPIIKNTIPKKIGLIKIYPTLIITEFID